MTITREQVADLREGDVVQLGTGRWAVGTVLRGPLWAQNTGALFLGDLLVRHQDGRPNTWEKLSLTVVSRAPRPLYVNHPRTEPVPGDVVRQEDGCPSGHTWHYLGYETPRWWRFDDTRIPFDKGARLRLLVDGETGQAVP